MRNHALPSAFCLFVMILLPTFAARSQILLTGTDYTQSFDSLGSGLPLGWSVYTGANATFLGNSSTFNTAPASWSATAGAFNNYASADNSGFTGSESSTIQAAAPDRALGIRQTGSFGDPGASFVFELANSTGYSNFQMDLKLEMLSVQGRSSTWTIDYATAAVPSLFTVIGTYTDPGSYGTSTFSYNFGNAMDNSNSPVWIRISALTPSTGTGSRDSFAIDDFHLAYTSTVPEPCAALLMVVGLGMFGLYSVIAPSRHKR